MTTEWELGAVVGASPSPVFLGQDTRMEKKVLQRFLMSSMDLS